MDRWYDKYRELGGKLDSISGMDPGLRDPLVKGIIDLIQEHSPDLLSSEKAFKFPLETNRRRWYDSDPYLWLLFNTLKSANIDLLQLITDYMEENLNLSESS